MGLVPGVDGDRAGADSGWEVAAEVGWGKKGKAGGGEEVAGSDGGDAGVSSMPPPVSSRRGLRVTM